MCSCCPSAFRPEVGPNVESEAGEPASPRAAAVPTREKVAIGEKPKAMEKNIQFFQIKNTYFSINSVLIGKYNGTFADD